MLTKRMIEINFQAAKNDARKLEDAANRLERLAKGQYEETMQGVSKSWKSDSAPEYVRKGRKVENDMLNTAKELKTLASQIRQAAQRMYNAEMRAVEIANTRTGSSGGGHGGGGGSSF